MSQPSNAGAWPPDVSGRLADYLREIRRHADLSQRELCAISGVPVVTLSRLESGTTSDPRTSTLARLISAAGLRLLICDDHNQPIPPQPEIFDQCRDLAGRRLPAHLDVRESVDDCFHPWWSPKRGDYTFVRVRRRRDNARAERRDVVERYVRDRLREDPNGEPVA